jgi:hypothetical protein
VKSRYAVSEIGASQAADEEISGNQEDASRESSRAAGNRKSFSQQAVRKWYRASSWEISLHGV